MPTPFSTLRRPPPPPPIPRDGARGAVSHRGPALRAGAGAGFSLVELLIVLGIVSVLMLIMIPVTNSMVQSYQLSSTSQIIQNQLAQARQMAVTSGSAVQVRLYFLPGAQAPATATPSVWRGMQCFVEGDVTGSGAAAVAPLTPVSMPVYFKSPAIILNNNQRSTILTLTPSAPTAAEMLPPFNQNYSYVSFRFRPTGETDLPETANCITVTLDRAPVAAQGLPANFRTLQINCRNGTVRSFP
ncbi:hypothetical protein DB346_07090 [Verrucomicrobia bacterium LW23]|nr:hypothetical protein DB346_07090 [Verrucomicrobia bacterium LW23]